MSCLIYADIESWIKKIDRCANNPENFSTTKIGEHIPCGYSIRKQDVTECYFVEIDS